MSLITFVTRLSFLNYFIGNIVERHFLETEEKFSLKFFTLDFSFSMLKFGVFYLKSRYNLVFSIKSIMYHIST